MNNTRKTKYSGAIISQMFLALLPAQILSSATASLSGIINGLVVGNYLSPECLVALGFVVPLTAILGAIAAVISGGARIMCGQYIGRGDMKKLSEIFSASMVILGIVGIVLTAVSLGFAPSIALILGAKGSANAATAEYIRGIALGIIPTIMVPGFMIFLQMINESTYSFISTLVLAVSSLVFGLLNVRYIHGDVFGMGVATSASQLITLIFLALRLLRKKSIIHYDRSSVSGKVSWLLIKLGSPTALAALLYALRNVFINSTALNVGGENAVTSLAILNSCAGLFDAVNIGVGAVALALSSVFVGEKDKDALHILFKKTLSVGLILAFAKVLLILFAGRDIVRFFGAGDEIVSMAHWLFICYSFSMPINIVLLAIISPLQSLGRIRAVNILYVFCAFIFPLCCCYFLSQVIGLNGIWLCYSIADLLGIIILCVISIFRRRRFPKTLFDTLCIDDDFSDGRSISISISSIDEVVNVSEKLVEFCLENGIDSRRSKLCGLFLEEMAGNVVSHGFTNGRKNKRYTVDIFVSCCGDELNMRLRDNAPDFDPRTKFAPFDPDDPCRNIGIRIVSKAAKEMNYQSCFGMNDFSIAL